MNFAGTGVTATMDGGTVTVTVSGGGAGSFSNPSTGPLDMSSYAVYNASSVAVGTNVVINKSGIYSYGRGIFNSGASSSTLFLVRPNTEGPWMMFQGSNYDYGHFDLRSGGIEFSSGANATSIFFTAPTFGFGSYVPGAKIHAVQGIGESKMLMILSTGTSFMYRFGTSSAAIGVPFYLDGFGGAGCDTAKFDANGMIICGEDGGGSGGADNFGNHVPTQPIIGPNIPVTFGSVTINGSFIIVGPAGVSIAKSTEAGMQFKVTNETDIDLEIWESSSSINGVKISTGDTAFQDEGTDIGSASKINITGTGGSASRTADVITIDLSAGGGGNSTDYYIISQLEYVAFSTSVVSSGAAVGFGHVNFQKMDSTGVYAVYSVRLAPGVDTTINPLLDYVMMVSTGKSNNPIYVNVAVGTPTADGIGNNFVLWSDSVTVVTSSETAGTSTVVKTTTGTWNLYGWRTRAAQSRTLLVKVWLWGDSQAATRFMMYQPAFIWKKNE